MGKLENMDDAIRNSFENFEVPFDASVWNSMESKMNDAPVNDLTSFDKRIKETVSGHEAAYVPSAWTAVESQLVTSYSYTKWFLAAGLIGLVSLGIYFFTDSENNQGTESDKKGKNELAENKVAETNSGKEVLQSVEKLNPVNEVKEEESSNEINSVFKLDEKEIIKSDEKTDQILREPNLGEIKKQDQNITPEAVNNKWNISTPTIIGKTEMCEGEEIKLTSSDVSEKMEIQWRLNGVHISSQKEIILKNIIAGTHEIELVHSAKEEFKSGCTNPINKKTSALSVKENSKVDFKYEQGLDAFYPETNFKVLSPEKNIRYTWVLDNISHVGEELIHLFKSKGNYPVKLMAESENGCIASESKNIEISNDYNLLAPNSFSPNFDGINDDFIPESLKYLNLPFKINIYDRQQGLVFQSNRSDYAWDGRNINTGDLCGQGAYLWVVELTKKDGNIERYSGTITLLK